LVGFKGFLIVGLASGTSFYKEGGHGLDWR
jgi:hypothetical protein